MFKANHFRTKNSSLSRMVTTSSAQRWHTRFLDLYWFPINRNIVSQTGFFDQAPEEGNLHALQFKTERQKYSVNVL